MAEMMKYLWGVYPALFISAVVYGQGSDITVTGSVKAAACEVSVDSKDFTVDMGKHSVYEFHQTGDSTSPVSFSIILAECPATTNKALVKLDGLADKNNKQLIRLDSVAGSAAGIGVAVYDNTGKILPLWTPSSSYNLHQGYNIMSFTARYVASKLPVSAGIANATSDFTLNYQ